MQRRCLFFLVLVMILNVFTACSKEEKEVEKKDSFVVENTDVHKNNKTSTEEETEPEVYDIPSEFVKDENIISIGDVVDAVGLVDESEKISYQIIDFEVSKELGNRKQETLADFVEVDTDGKLLSDESFVFVKINIQNNSDYVVNVCRSVGNVMGRDADNMVWQLGENVYIDECWKGGEPNQEIYCDLAPGEKIESEVGYLVPDEYLESDKYVLLYEIPMEESKYIKLDNTNGD